MANPLETDFDISKLFIGNNKFKTATYTNSTGSEVELVAGRIFGRILDGTNKVKPQASVNSSKDGSEIPRFVLASSHTVANGASVTVTLCYAGDVAAEQLSFSDSDTLATIVDEYATSPITDYDKAGTIEDLLVANSHISVITATELTKVF